MSSQVCDKQCDRELLNCELLRCPVCRAKLETSDLDYVCTNSSCGVHFPVVDGIPVLINEQSSVFSFDDFLSYRKTFFSAVPERKIVKAVKRMIPSIDGNFKSGENFKRFNELLHKQSASPRVLVIGGSILGCGMESLAADMTLDMVETDVSFGPRTMLICDAHDIPFGDGSFDGVIVQATLEHVVDPRRCVDEVYRVLKDRGLVYVETPFMQQVHGGRYDFTRFTHLGHRRMFREFDEIESGAVCGPGMALAWSYMYFLLSFSSSKAVRSLLRIFAKFTAFYLKYFDRFLMGKPGALDAASGVFFLGRKSDKVLADRDLIRLYRGADSL